MFIIPEPGAEKKNTAVIFRPTYCREGDRDLKEKKKEGSVGDTEVVRSQISTRKTKMLNTSVVSSQ